MSCSPFNNMIFWILLTALSIIQLTCIAGSIPLHQSPRFITANQSAKIFCNYTLKREGLKKASLLKGGLKTEVCSISWNSSYNSTKGNNSELSCHVQVFRTENKIIFDLDNLNVNHTDNYFCEIEFIDPAPYEVNTSLHGTLIHVKAPVLQCHQGGPEYLGMAAAIGVLLVYSAVLTVTVYYCWQKAKKSKTVRNDYLNMTPWQSNGQKKRHHQPGVPTRNYTAYRSWEP